MVCCVGNLDSGWVLENQKANSFLSVAQRETFRGHKVCVHHICLHYVCLEGHCNYLFIIQQTYLGNHQILIVINLFKMLCLLFTCVQREKLTQVRELFESQLNPYGKNFKCIISRSYLLNHFQKNTPNQVNNVWASC